LKRLLKITIEPFPCYERRPVSARKSQNRSPFLCTNHRFNFKTREQTFLTALIITLITQVSMEVSFTRKLFFHNIYTHLFCTNYLKYSFPSYNFFVFFFSFEHRDSIPGILSSCVLFVVGIMSVCGTRTHDCRFRFLYNGAPLRSCDHRICYCTRCY
jgi:hypothetical protein